MRSHKQMILIIIISIGIGAFSFIPSMVTNVNPLKEYNCFIGDEKLNNTGSIYLLYIVEIIPFFIIIIILLIYLKYIIALKFKLNKINKEIKILTSI
jgi:hypothetical protein